MAPPCATVVGDFGGAIFLGGTVDEVYALSKLFIGGYRSKMVREGDVVR